VTITLAFELAALRRLADPEAAAADARTWCENVGFVTNRPPYVLTKFTRDHHLRNDFEPASEPAAETLGHLLEHFDTDRFVFVARDADAAPNGWEHRPVSSAAERADWELGAADDSGEDSDDASGSRQRDDWP